MILLHWLSHYQLYLSGIETKLYLCSTGWLFPINCTYLELKLAIVCAVSAVPTTLSIVPIWNWNNITGVLFKMHSGYQLYLSGIETRLYPLLLHKLHLSIVPIWNWNLIKLYAVIKVLKLSIVPIWNWNGLFLQLVIYSELLSIVPIWNWN